MLDILKYRVKKPYHFLKTGILGGLPAELQTHHPQKKLFIIMVTGTDGKTTTATLLHHVLSQAGIKTGLLTTIAAKIGQAEIETGLHVTAPHPRELYSVLARMVQEGCTHAVIEMTSHGAYQYRNWGITPQIGVITNITNEHLDYHITFEEYVKAKAKLFSHTPKVIVHSHDPCLELLRRYIQSSHLITAARFSALPPEIKSAIQQRFPQMYNQRNASLVWTVAKELKIPHTDFATAITTFPVIPGRMQTIPIRAPYQVIVDFAHTPAGVQAVLTVLKKQLQQQKKPGRLISVLGCAGLRDTTKRARMGQLAAQYSDLAIFTAEDPRTEDIWSIIRQMKEQIVDDHSTIASIADRGEALFFALKKCAKKGDVVVILGKGHEKSLCIGEQEFPWSDSAAVQWILEKNSVPQLGIWQPAIAANKHT